MTNLVVKEEESRLPADIEQQHEYAKQLCTSEMVPQRFKNKPRDLWVAMKTADELGLPPLSAIRQIAVIKGTPSLYGDLPMALALKSGNVEYHNEYFLEKGGAKICEENDNLLAEPFAAVCKVRRKGDTEDYVSIFTTEDAKRANLSGPCWKSFTADMLKYRARSRALKAKFADAINGIAIAEYDFHVMPGVDGEVFRDVSAGEDYTSKYSR